MSLDLGLSTRDWDIAEGTSLNAVGPASLAAMLGRSADCRAAAIILAWRWPTGRFAGTSPGKRLVRAYELYRESLPSAWEQELNHPPVRGEDVGAFIALVGRTLVHRTRQTAKSLVGRTRIPIARRLGMIW
jgi:hypothetical protein